MMAFQILVVEDEVEMANSIRLELEDQGYQVSLAHDGTDGLLQARKSYFDLIMLDWLLPNTSGIEICRRLRHTRNQVPIVFVTILSEVKDRVRILDSGADDYLLKPFDIEELLAKVKSNLRRAYLFKQEVIRFADLQLDIISRQVYRGSRLIKLTPKEFDLLKYLMFYPKQILKHQQIFQKVWGYDHLNNRSTSTIEVHIRHLRQKLEQNQEKRLIQTVRGIGYVLRE